MKRRTKTIVIIVSSAAVGLLITLGGIHLVGVFLDKQYVNLHEGCAPRQIDHKVVIKGGIVSPSNVVGSRCDTMTVTNLDSTERLMAFGAHDKHVAYDGITEQVLEKGQSFTVTLVQTGSFKIHDHEHDEVQATFQVTN